MPVFFIPSTAIQGNTVTLSGQLFTHIHKSLRIRTGQSIWVCDDQRTRYSITIIEITKKHLVGEVQETHVGPSQDTPKITLALSILKGEHMAWGIQKATELGVDTIAPIISERVQNRMNSKSMNHIRDRWQRIATEAAQQSERWDVPTILTPQPFHTFLQEQLPTQMNFILTEREIRRPSSSLPFNQKVQTASYVVLAIGPEGGWTQKEIQGAEREGFTRITLGEKVLRSETAALTGLILLQERLKHVTFEAITAP